MKIDGSLIGSHGGINSTFADKNDICFMTSASAIGLHKSAMVGTGTGMANRMGFATGIHTSHHYQSFETPFLNELVGGDRNMEQTNLVVTSDGKIWDEVTRDTSYIGNMTLHTSHGGGHFAGNQKWKPSLYRGVSNGHLNWGNKDFAIAWDRWICLRDGEYLINGTFHASSAADLILNMQYSQGHFYQRSKCNLPDWLNIVECAY